jgi:hypothetical protein
VRVIAASGMSDEGRLNKLMDEEIQAFLLKPYTAETLLIRTLNEVVDRSKGIPGQ